MCLAVPMKIVKIDKKEAIAELGGVKKKIHLGLLKDVKRGDYVIVHAGFAIQKLEKKEANEKFSLLEELWNI